MTRDTFFPGLAVVVRNVVCWCSVIWLFSIIMYREPQGLQMLPFLVAGAIAYLICGWFLKVPRPLLVLVVLWAALTACISALLLWRFFSLTGLWWNLFAMAAVGAVVFRGIQVSLEPLTAEKYMTTMEGTVGFFLFSLWLQIILDMDIRYSAPLLGACLISLIMVLHQRLYVAGAAERRNPLRGLLMLVALAGVVGVLILFMLFGAEPLGYGVEQLFLAVVYCLKLLLRLLAALFRWYESLFPPAEHEMDIEIPEVYIPEEEIRETSEIDLVLTIIMGIAVVCAAVYGLVRLIWRLRTKRVGGRTSFQVKGQAQRRRVSLLRWLGNVLAAIGRRIRLSVTLLAMRGSPMELYFFLKRAGRRLNCRQQPGETPCAFIRRAARMTEGNAEPELLEALEAIAQALGEHLYAQQIPAPLPRETGRCVRRNFRRALRRARWERMRKWVAAHIPRAA